MCLLSDNRQPDNPFISTGTLEIFAAFDPARIIPGARRIFRVLSYLAISSGTPPPADRLHFWIRANGIIRRCALFTTMQKRQVNAIVDLALLVAFVIVALSSIVLLFFLPSAGGGWVHASTGVANLKVFLGVTRGQWVDLHNITGIVFIVLMAVHTLLHIPYFRNIRRCLLPGKNDRCENE